METRASCEAFPAPTAALLLLVAALAPHAQSRAAAGPAVALAPTIHPAVPTELSQVWLAPERGAVAAGRTASPIATVIRLQATGDYTRALATASQAAAQQGALAQSTASYCRGRAIASRPAGRRPPRVSVAARTASGRISQRSGRAW